METDKCIICHSLSLYGGEEQKVKKKTYNRILTTGRPPVFSKIMIHFIRIKQLTQKFDKHLNIYIVRECSLFQ